MTSIEPVSPSPELSWQRNRAKKTELDRLPARHPRACAHLDPWYDIELTYTANAIEGNTLTRQETALVVTEGLTPKSKPVRDVDEAFVQWLSERRGTGGLTVTVSDHINLCCRGGSDERTKEPSL